MPANKEPPAYNDDGKESPFSLKQVLASYIFKKSYRPRATICNSFFPPNLKISKRVHPKNASSQT
jgi:hypothetical protein